MSINSVGYTNTPLAQAMVSLSNQMQTLSTQLATGEKSTTYAGMGVNEGFAIAARSQLASISAFTDTISNVGTQISAANNALQSLSDLAGQVQNASAQSPQTLDSNGKTIAQENAGAEFDSMIGILNTPAGDRYLFSGSATNTQATAPADQILNGTATQAGLKQLIAERAQADGTTGTGRLVISNPAATPTVVSVAEDVAGSPFGLKLDSVSSSLTGATVTGPSGSPAGISVDLGATNPNPGDQVTFTFNLPDGTQSSVQLTATNTTPAPSGSFTIGSTPTATAANLNTALNSSITTLSGTTLVAASAVAAGDNFFNTASVATGSVANTANPVPVTGSTLLSGAPGSNSVSPGFAAGDTITVNGTPITFVASGATGNQVNVTDSVQTLLSKIDAITGTSTPSTVSGGVITLNDDAGSLSVASSPAGALSALGFSGTITGATASGTAVNTAPAVITGATLLSGGPGTNSVSPGFAAGDSITVNGTTISFVNNGATGNQVNVTDSIQTLLSKIDAITGTSTPSTVSGGVVEIHTDDASSLNITSSPAGALSALGFSSGTVTAPIPPLRVSGSPLSSATSLVAGTPANTVSWYTGNSGPGSARASSTARIDSSITVQYGAQANESAIRSQLQSIAVFAAFSASATGANSAAQISALSQRTATNLTPQPGQQTIQDIQSDFASAQTVMQNASARQAQSQTMLQTMVDNTETVSTQQVATEILALQTQLQASYQTTSMLSQLTLTKYLSAG